MTDETEFELPDDVVAALDRIANAGEDLVEVVEASAIGGADLIRLVRALPERARERLLALIARRSRPIDREERGYLREFAETGAREMEAAYAAFAHLLDRLESLDAQLTAAVVEPVATASRALALPWNLGVLIVRLLQHAGVPEADSDAIVTALDSTRPARSRLEHRLTRLQNRHDPAAGRAVFVTSNISILQPEDLRNLVADLVAAEPNNDVEVIDPRQAGFGVTPHSVVEVWLPVTELGSHRALVSAAKAWMQARHRADRRWSKTLRFFNIEGVVVWEAEWSGDADEPTVTENEPSQATFAKRRPSA